MRTEKEQDEALEAEMEKLSDSVIAIGLLAVEQAIPEFMDWFVKAGGSIVIPKGKTLSELAQQYVDETRADLYESSD